MALPVFRHERRRDMMMWHTGALKPIDLEHILTLSCCALASFEFVLPRCSLGTPDAIAAAHVKQPPLADREHTAMETVSRIHFDLLLYWLSAKYINNSLSAKILYSKQYLTVNTFFTVGQIQKHDPFWLVTVIGRFVWSRTFMLGVRKRVVVSCMWQYVRHGYQDLFIYISGNILPLIRGKKGRSGHRILSSLIAPATGSYYH